MDDAPERVLYQRGFVDAWRTDLPPERAHIPAVEYIRADAAHLAAPAVKVKPLVWKWSDQLHRWRADCDQTGDVFAAYQSGENWCVWSKYFVSTFHQTSDAGKSHLDQMRAARILAAIEAVPVAEVWRRAMEAAAQAVEQACTVNEGDDHDAYCAGFMCGAKHQNRSDAAAIRAIPMPDDLGVRHD
jgi:hypothetical protein